jgi:DegV family protein with EDD domain
MKVSVVTDSTSDLPPEVARELGITVVPAQIQFGEQVFLDGVELTTDEFYRRLQSSSTLPKTSPASISTFNSIYRRIAEQADSIISIHVAARLSVTYDIAAKAARAGESLKDIEELVRQAIPNTVRLACLGLWSIWPGVAVSAKGRPFWGRYSR